MTLNRIYKNGVLQNSSPISAVGRPIAGTMGELSIVQFGNTTANQISYVDSILLSDAKPFHISGNLYEKESDAAGSPEHYLIINPTNGAVLKAGTAEANGSFDINSDDDTTEYALVMPDKDGSYAPTCLNHYITGV